MIGKPNHLTGGGTKAANDVADYLESRARENANVGGYYENHCAPSFWSGAGAEALGLVGDVKREDLVEVLQGRLPTGEDISSRGNRQADRRMATDLTLSLPKSFSMLACAGSDPRLKDLGREAAEVALRVIEDEVITARRGRGGSEVEHTRSMVAAVYQHEDARQVDGVADMDLHYHMLIMNVTQRSDGVWCARDLDFGERNVTRMVADFAAKAHLAKRLQEFGYEIRRTQDGFEIEGISDNDITLFSRRKEQVDAALEARGLTREDSTSSQREAANLATRGNKATLGESAQRWEWRTRLRDAGVNLDAIVKDAQARGNASIADLSAEAVKAGTRHIAERETVFSRSALRLEALKAGMGDATLAGVDRAIEAESGGLLDAGDGKFTTRDALHREQAILARALAGRGKVDALMTESEANAYVSQREVAQDFKYSDGQREALLLGLTSTDTVTGVVGVAGSGKTTATGGLVEAARNQGFEVIGIAPSAKARDELAGAGAEVNRTVASFLAREHDYSDNRLVILDEAGMVSARDMDAVMQKVEAEGGRLVLVGDPRQLKAVEAGQPFAQLLETGAIAHAKIDEIKRQTDLHLREIAQSFARGDAVGATAMARDYMVAARIEAQDPAKPTTEERREAIAQRTAQTYLDIPIEKRARTLVLSGTNEVRQQVNEVVRAHLQEQGVVSRAEVRFCVLDKAGFTLEKAARAESYQSGMVVRLEEGKGRNRHTIDYTVARTDGNRVVLRAPDGTEKVWNPAREKDAKVYLPREIPLAAGDQIVFRDKVGAGADKIENGRAAVVERVGKDGIDARLDDGRQVRLGPKQRHVIDYGWCRTINSSQGATMANVIVAGEASRVATAEAAYVACSRVGLTRAEIKAGERESLTIITDNPDRLQKSWAVWSEKKHALTAARDASRPDAARLQALRAEAAAEIGRAGDLAAAREVRADRQAEPPKVPAAPVRKRERELER